MRDSGKEAIQVSGADELLFVTALVCIATVVLWELGKFIVRWVARQFKGARKARKLEALRRLAAEAAMHEVSSTTSGAPSGDAGDEPFPHAPEDLPT